MQNYSFNMVNDQKDYLKQFEEKSPTQDESKVNDNQNLIKQNQNQNKSYAEAYTQDLQNIIRKNWHPTAEYIGKKVVVLFTLLKDGTLVGSVQIVQSSGNENIDKAAAKAVYESMPFPPLPKEYNGNSVDIRFTFDLGLNTAY